MVKSISYDQSEIIKGILNLHVKNHRIDCDSTYSVGNFYKNTGVEEPVYKFDIKPHSMIDQFEPMPEGWRIKHDLGGWLCSECIKQYDQMIKNFKLSK